MSHAVFTVVFGNLGLASNKQNPVHPESIARRVDQMAQQPAISTQVQVDPLERETIRRIAWRLMPLLMLGYFCAYLDRVNVGFAKLTMQHALNFSEAVFGFGAGVFFIGY